MIRPQVPEYSRPFQLSLLRIVGGKPLCGASNSVLLSFSVAPLGGAAYGAIVRARPPAAAPAGGGVACRVPAPGLPPSSSMPRGPPPRPPLLFPEHRAGDGNRMGMDSCAPVCPTAASGPGFHVRWPPSGPRVSARAIPVSAGGRGPPADARVPPVAMDFGTLSWSRVEINIHSLW